MSEEQDPLALVNKYLKEKEAKGGSEEEDESSSEEEMLLLQPGFAPAPMFSPQNLRESMQLGMSTSSNNNMRTVRIGQLQDWEKETTTSTSSSSSSSSQADDLGMDLRASQIHQKISSFQRLMQSSRTGLTQSQSTSVNVYLGNFGEMISKLELLIQQHIDDPERLGNLIALHEAISETLRAYEISRTDWTNTTTSTSTSTSTGGSRGHPTTDRDDWQLHMTDDEFLNLILEREAKGRADADYFFDSKPKEKEEEKKSDDDADDEDDEEGEHEGQEQKECPICMDDFWWPGKKGYQLKCGCLYCKPCLRSNYEVLINDGAVLKLHCPNPTCNAKVDEEDLSKILKPEMFTKFQQFYILASLRNDPSVRWCPRIGCETPAQGSEENCHLKCTTCGTEYCWKCNCEWHPNISCEKAKKNASKGKGRQKRQDRKAQRYIRRRARPCPRCQTPIQKNSGCNHMHCASCGYDFCWVCMQQFGGYDHFRSGKCKGLQNWPNHAAKYGAYAGIGLGIGVGGLVLAPIVIGIGIPALAIGAPIYGAYKLIT
jgi:ariadne-1